jgi:hypothetical protein
VAREIVGVRSSLQLGAPRPPLCLELQREGTCAHTNKNASSVNCHLQDARSRPDYTVTQEDCVFVASFVSLEVNLP